MIAKLICRLLGHKRRKREKKEGGDVLRCPRCNGAVPAKAR